MTSIGCFGVMGCSFKGTATQDDKKPPDSGTWEDRGPLFRAKDSQQLLDRGGRVAARGEKQRSHVGGCRDLGSKAGGDSKGRSGK